MASPVVLAPVVTGLPLSGTDLNNNWALVENAFTDVAPYIISGLAISIGTGLSVNVALGVAVIGAEISKTASVIGSLTPSTTVHLFLNQDGTYSKNTTGIQPAKSVKLGTAATGISTVTSVSMGRTSGRQQFVQPQNLIPGGPAAGTTSAGHPDGLNLANWGSSDTEGQAFFGVLPAGATAGVAAPLTLTLDDANQNSVQTALTLAHSYNAGGGAAGIGVELDLNVESSTNGTLKTAANLQATLTDLTPATATGKLALRVIANNAQVTPLTVATGDIRVPQATVASSQHGLLNIGAGGFDGSAGHFAGDSPGTLLALNAPAGYTGTYLDVQKNGARLLYLDQFGTLFRLSAPVGTANDGQLSLGDAFTAFDGSTTGKFVGSASGTYLAVNAGSGFTGSLIDAQLQGAARFKVSNTGALTATDAALLSLTDAGTSTEPTLLTVQHRSSGTPGASFGATVLLRADNASNALTDQLSVAAGWSSATGGAENSLAIFSVRRAGANVEVLRLTSAGNGRTQVAQDFFHSNASGAIGVFGITPVAQQANASQADVTAITDTHAKAAVQAIYNLLKNYGFAPATA